MRKWAFIMEGVGISGGTSVIFNYCMRLHQYGIQATLITNNKISLDEVAWHPISMSSEVRWRTLEEAENEQFDIAIAGFWHTFYKLCRIRSSKYAYFVQSIESRFYPTDQQHVREYVDKTYEPRVGIVTIAKWIKDYLGKLYLHDGKYVQYGVDKNIFSEDVLSLYPKGREIRILLEGPVDVPFKNVSKTRDICQRANLNDVCLLTSSVISNYDGVHRIFSGIPINQVGAVYKSCDVIVKLSLVEGMFGPPLEMFHSGGTCIVYNVTGYDEYIKHGYNGLVANIHDESKVIEYLQDLKDSPELLMYLKKNAKRTAEEWPDWNVSTCNFVEAMQASVEYCTVTQQELRDFSDEYTSIYHRKSKIYSLQRV